MSSKPEVDESNLFWPPKNMNDYTRLILTDNKQSSW